MARSYKLDANHARAGDGGLSIDTTGLYFGTLTEVKEVLNKNKTEGVEMTFDSDTGAQARFLSLWTYNAAGEEIYGLKKFNALMACMSVREINPADSLGDEFVNGSFEKDVKITIYPEMMGPKVGLVLQKKLYTKSDGSDGESMEIIASCNAESRKTASEILDKKDATAIDSMLKNIAEVRDERKNKNAKSAEGQEKAPAGGKSSVADDIVF